LRNGYILGILYISHSVVDDLPHKLLPRLALTSGGNNFNDFPDNQLTKFHVFW